MTGGTEAPPVSGATRMLALALVGALVLDIGLAWVTLQAALSYVRLVWHALAGEFLPGWDLGAHARQFRTLRGVQHATWAVTAVLFLRWLGWAQRRLPAGNTAGPDSAPRGVVAAFIVPGPNLVRPLRLVTEVWNASDPRHRGGPGWRAAGTPRAVAWWWWLLVTATLGELSVAVLGWWRSGTPLHLGGALQLLVIAAGVEIAAAVLAIVIVVTVERFQGVAVERPAVEVA